MPPGPVPPTDNRLYCPTPFSVIQNGAESILTLIEKEKAQVSYLARQDFLQLEHHFLQFQKSSEIALAVEKTKTADAHRELLESERRFRAFREAQAATEYKLQEAEASAKAARDERDKVLGDFSQVLVLSMETQREAASAKGELNKLKACLERVGITFYKGNNLSFGEGWRVVVAELERIDGPLTPEILRESLDKLAHRLEEDQEALGCLKEQLRVTEEERDQITRDSQAEIAALKARIASLQNPADVMLAPHSPHVPVASNQRDPESAGDSSSQILEKRDLSTPSRKRRISIDADQPDVKRHKLHSPSAASPSQTQASSSQ